MYEQFSAPSSLLKKFRFLVRRPLATETLFEPAVRLLRRKAEHVVLSGPLRRQVGEASHPHAMRQPAIDGGLDEIGGKESQRDCHVDLSRAAVFPLRDAIRTCCCVSDEFIKPTAATGNCCHQSRTRLETDRTRVFRADSLRQKNFTAPPCWRLLPRDLKSIRLAAIYFLCLGKLDD